MLELDILIIDDEPKCCENITILFDEIQHGYNLNYKIANSFSEAKDFLSSNTPDIVFLDLSLPDGLGLELAKLINPETTYIIIVSAYDNYALEAYKHKVLSYLLKPIDIDEFNQAIHRVLRYISLEKENSPKIDSNESNQFMVEFKNLIIENIQNEEIEIEHISKYFNLTHRTLYNRTMQYFALSPSQSIHLVRLEFAYTLLKTNQYNISEVAYQSGYSSLSHFSRLFKKKYGMSPSSMIAR
jgi:YesN/AraC family two-component response regulator